jgi:hypothetical protein
VLAHYIRLLADNQKIGLIVAVAVSVLSGSHESIRRLAGTIQQMTDPRLADLWHILDQVSEMSRESILWSIASGLRDTEDVSAIGSHS